MKTIILVRHAKSDWSTPNLSDFNRPLNKRGLRDAPDMGSRLSKKGINPELILLSSSMRTRLTMNLIMENANWQNINRIEKESLYLASSNTYLDEVERIEDALSCILICGHNPSITMAVNSLSGENIGNVPTCGVAMIQFDVNSWSEISNHSGTLIHYDYPKNV